MQTTLTKKSILRSGLSSINIDETTTQAPELDIQVTTVKPADINLIPNTVVLQQVVAPGVMTNPDDQQLTSTEKTRPVSHFLIASFLRRSKELLHYLHQGNFVRLENIYSNFHITLL